MFVQSLSILLGAHRPRQHQATPVPASEPPEGSARCRPRRVRTPRPARRMPHICLAHEHTLVRTCSRGIVGSSRLGHSLPHTTLGHSATRGRGDTSHEPAERCTRERHNGALRTTVQRDNARQFPRSPTFERRQPTPLAPLQSTPPRSHPATLGQNRVAGVATLGQRLSVPRRAVPLAASADTRDTAVAARKLRTRPRAPPRTPRRRSASRLLPQARARHADHVPRRRGTPAPRVHHLARFVDPTRG